MNDSDIGGSIGDLFSQYGGWIMVVPAVALAWGILTGVDKGRARVRKYKSKRKRVSETRAAYLAAKKA